MGQKCAECARPKGRARVINARQALGKPSFQTAPVTFSIMAITGAIFVVGVLSPDAHRWLLNTFAQANWLVEAGEWWRVFTVALLHGGFMHIAFNMYALYLFGPRLERQVGGPAFAALYVAAAGAGGTLSYLFGPIGQVSVGASGAIFGLLGAWMFVAWKMRNTPGGREMFNQLGVLLAINLALPLFVGGIDWRAHFGGLASGILIAWLWSLFAVGRSDAKMIRTVIASGVAVLAAVLAMTL